MHSDAALAVIECVRCDKGLPSSLNTSQLQIYRHCLCDVESAVQLDGGATYCHRPFTYTTFYYSRQNYRTEFPPEGTFGSQSQV